MGAASAAEERRGCLRGAAEPESVRRDRLDGRKRPVHPGVSLRRRSGNGADQPDAAAGRGLPRRRHGAGLGARLPDVHRRQRVRRTGARLSAMRASCRSSHRDGALCRMFRGRTLLPGFEQAATPPSPQAGRAWRGAACPGRGWRRAGGSRPGPCSGRGGA